MSSAVVSVTRGSDLTMPFQINQPDGTPLPVSEVVLIDVATSLAGLLTVVETDFALGSFDVILEGSGLLEVRAHTFRWQATLLNGDTLGSPVVHIDVT